jgi:hypothetical protein
VGVLAVTIARLMSRRALIAVLTAAGLALAAAPAARADWQRITPVTPTTTTGEVSLLRLSDGLHVVWRAHTSRFRSHLSHRVVGNDGATLSAPRSVTEDWIELGDPALTAGPDGLRVIFGGVHTTHPDEINTEINTAVSVDGGLNWGLQDGSIVPLGRGWADDAVSAAAQADGIPLAAWADGRGVWIHRGLDPNAPPVDLQAPLGPFGTGPGVAAAEGRTVVAWFSASSAARGVYAQDIGPDGAPIGAPAPMPDSTSLRAGMAARTPVAVRPGGRAYVAYPTGSNANRAISLWSVGSARTVTIGRSTGAAFTTVAAGASGRMWVAWTATVNGRRHVLARRSNPAVSRWGAVVDAGRPDGGATAGALNGNDANGALDLTASFTIGDSDRASTFHERVLPGLTMNVSGAKVTVTDAGDPVPGVRVTGGGRRTTTDASGQATLRVAAGTVVRGSLAGYATATATAR